jgi:hypothetical protein
MVPEIELSRRQRQRGKRMEREGRALLIDADGDLRPSLLWNTLAIGLGEQDRVERAQRRVEIGFRAMAYTVVLLALVLFVVDLVRHNEHYRVTSVLFIHPVLAGVVFGVSLLMLGFLLLDVGTYQPRLFAGCANASAEAFFTDLSKLCTEVVDQLNVLAGAHVTTWRDHDKEVEALLTESNNFLLLHRLRRGITLRVLFRLTAIICALALVGYGLSGLLGDDVVHAAGYAPGLGFPEHLYFTITAFFTIGFGDVTPTKDLAGYLYIGTIIAVFALVAYFVLTDIAASHGEFRMNIRVAARALVMKHSAL